MRALAGAGNRAEAVRAYGQRKKLLAEELCIAPSRETEAMLKELRARG
jgi:DNA-binding SARP family transcriptional activator